MGQNAKIFIFGMLSFKPEFSLSFFTLIKHDLIFNLEREYHWKLYNYVECLCILIKFNSNDSWHQSFSVEFVQWRTEYKLLSSPPKDVFIHHKFTHQFNSNLSSAYYVSGIILDPEQGKYICSVIAQSLLVSSSCWWLRVSLYLGPNNSSLCLHLHNTATATFSLPFCSLNGTLIIRLKAHPHQDGLIPRWYLHCICKYSFSK